ncbi:MAG: DUF4279 domain-containing protein [Myxococcales bacterium]|nr:DUF4279 domain-containing protein [Myxococcales bacterium]
MFEYDDEYPSCRRTYATFRLFSSTATPEEIGRALLCEPTDTHHRGDRVSSRSNPRANASSTSEARGRGTTRRREPEGRPTRYAVRPTHGWFLSTEAALASKDTRRHLDWLLDRLEPRAAELAELLANGAEADIFCFWASARGQGGPTLSPPQMRRLASLQLSCSYDCYGPDDEV